MAIEQCLKHLLRGCKIFSINGGTLLQGRSWQNGGMHPNAVVNWKHVMNTANKSKIVVLIVFILCSFKKT